MPLEDLSGSFENFALKLTSSSNLKLNFSLLHFRPNKEPLIDLKISYLSTLAFGFLNVTDCATLPVTDLSVELPVVLEYVPCREKLLTDAGIFKAFGFTWNEKSFWINFPLNFNFFWFLPSNIRGTSLQTLHKKDILALTNHKKSACEVPGVKMQKMQTQYKANTDAFVINVAGRFTENFSFSIPVPATTNACTVQ